MLVTVSGLPGSGTSTLSSALADVLGLEHLDGGQVFRSMAAERGVDVHAFGRAAEADPAIDIELDRRLARRAAEGDVVLESRLAGWIATHDDLVAVRVWVRCGDEVRAQRVARRDGLDPAEAAAQNRTREASEAARYRSCYDVDIADLAPYDLVLDSASATVADLVDRVVAAVGR